MAVRSGEEVVLVAEVRESGGKRGDRGVVEGGVFWP